MATRRGAPCLHLLGLPGPAHRNRTGNRRSALAGIPIPAASGERGDRVPAGPLLLRRALRDRHGAVQPPGDQPNAFPRQPSRRRDPHPRLDRRVADLHGAQLRDAHRRRRTRSAWSVAADRVCACRHLPAARLGQRGADRPPRDLLLGASDPGVRLPRLPRIQQAPPHHHLGTERLLQERAAQGSAAHRRYRRRDERRERGRPALRRRRARALLVEGHARPLHVHRMRAVSNALPRVQHRQAALAQDIDHRSARSRVREPRGWIRRNQARRARRSAGRCERRCRQRGDVGEWRPSP